MNTPHRTPSGRELVAYAAHRRARFMRDEVQSGRVPATHPLGRAYLEEAERLTEVLYPAHRWPAAAAAAELRECDADATVDAFRSFLDGVTPDDFTR